MSCPHTWLRNEWIIFVLFYVFFCVVPCIVCFVTFSVLFVCIRVLNYCHRVATQLQLNIYHIISYHIISYHIISYHIISYHIISYRIVSYHIIPYHTVLDWKGFSKLCNSFFLTCKKTLITFLILKSNCELLSTAHIAVLLCKVICGSGLRCSGWETLVWLIA